MKFNNERGNRGAVRRGGFQRGGERRGGERRGGERRGGGSFSSVRRGDRGGFKRDRPFGDRGRRSQRGG